MPLKPLATALFAALALAAPAQAAAPKPTGGPATLTPSLVRGGEVGTAPVAVGTHLYVSTGRVVTAWDYRNAARPVRGGSALPVDGVINGLAAHDGYLYASWRGWDATSGVAVYSLADPAAPVLVRQVAYTDGEYLSASGVAVANGHLYVFDSETGVFGSDLADPANPVFAPVPGVQSGSFGRIQVDGNMVYASGRNWFGNLEFHTYDFTNPMAPTPLSTQVLYGLDVFSVATTTGHRAIGAGYAFATYDISVPGELTELSRQEVEMPAVSAAAVGNRAYTFGFEGLQTWDIRNLASPRRIGTDSVKTLGGSHFSIIGGTLVVPTATDLIQAWNTRPMLPKHASSAVIPAGVAPYDVAEHDGRILLLQNGYGLTVNDPQTLDTTARLEPALPNSLQTRAYEGMAVDGDTAYLASWGSGLILADLSGAQPVEVGRYEYPLLSSVAARGDHAWLIKHTNGDELVSVDVSNPAAPVGLYSIALPAEPYEIEVAGDYAFLAEGYGENTGGLRVFSLANPAQPADVGHLANGCGAAFDLSVDIAANRAYLACDNGMQVVDISTPATPVLLGSAPSAADYNAYTKVAHRGNRVWFSDSLGLHEYDVTNPAAPVLVASGGLGRRDLQALKALADGRVVAVGSAGVQVFGEVAPPDRAPLRKSATAVQVKVPKAR